MLITCLQCRTENDAEQQACNRCGCSLELICDVCGYANRVGDRYCGACGLRLEPLANGTVVEAEADAAGLDETKRDELRTITVMMADLDGFAEMTDQLGRERQTEVMNTVFERLAQQHIVAAFDGYIDKFLDGDIMALFGAPVAHEDSPERALRAAVRMHATLVELHAEGVIPAETPLRLRIGLNTGPVRVGGVGAGGRMEYTAMGDTVNLAARLMTACVWGQTLISVNTCRRAGASFELQELEPVKVKGKSQPVPIWAVLAEKRRAARVELAQAEGMSRMVGREALLQQAVEAFGETTRGHGQLVAVRGEAGIGKSRLVFELCQQVQSFDAVLVEGRCLSYGVSQSYLPIRDVLAEICEISDSDSADQRRTRIRSTLNDLGVGVDDYGAAVGAVFGLDFGDEEFDQLDPPARRERMRTGVFEMFAALGRRHQAVVLFFDDLQWCDSDSREMVDDIAARCAESAILLLAAYRPDFQHEYQQFDHFLLLEPQRLDLEQTRQMVGSLLHQRGYIEDEHRIDDSLAEAVYHKAQGNPFFIDQTVSALVDRAEQSGRPTVDFRRGRLLITEEELHDLVPDSVEEILLARIDRLPERPRSLLQAASVAMIGRYFRRSALEFALGVGEANLDAWLGLLQQRELVRLEERTEDDEEYVFEHALTRDVAYNALLRSERRRLHGQVGEYIEQHYANSLEAYLDDLSHHFYNSAFAVRALHYLPQSGDRAARIFSNQQAVLYYKRALEKADEVETETPAEVSQDLPAARLGILKGLTAVQALVGDREGLEYGKRRLKLARETGDDESMLDASFMLGRQYTELGQFDEAQGYWDLVLQEYENREAWDAVRDTEFGIFNFFIIQGRYDRAVEHIERAVEIQREKLEFDAMYQCAVTSNLAAMYEAVGRFDDALETCNEAVRLLDELPEDDPMRARLACFPWGVRGSAYRNVGRLDEALEAYQRTLDGAQATGDKATETEVRHWLGRTLLLPGRVKEADAQLDESAALARETGNSRWEVSSLAIQADVMARAGQLDEAEALARQGREVLAQVGELAGAGDLALSEARIHLARGRPEAAVELLRQLIDEAEEKHQEVERVLALPTLALAEQALGRPSALSHAVDAVMLAESMGMAPLAAEAQLVRAEVLREEDPAAAREAVDEALEAADEMGAAELLVHALGLRALLRVETERHAAMADLEEAEARLSELAETAGPELVKALRQRYLAEADARIAAG